MILDPRNWTKREERPIAVVDDAGNVWAYSYSDFTYSCPKFWRPLVPENLEEKHGPCTPLVLEPSDWAPRTPPPPLSNIVRLETDGLVVTIDNGEVVVKRNQ